MRHPITTSVICAVRDQNGTDYPWSYKWITSTETLATIVKTIFAGCVPIATRRRTPSLDATPGERWLPYDQMVDFGSALWPYLTNIIDFSSRPYRKTVLQIGDEVLSVPDVEAMDEALIDNWNDVVDPGDEVWVVGDLAMGRRQTTVPMAKRLKGRKFLLPGNHDDVHRMYPKWRKAVPLYEDAGFTILDSQVTTTIGDTEVLVCHFPYTGDSKFNDRFSGLRPIDEGGWLIHGHTHSDVKVRGKQIHVGVDSWNYTPVAESEIERIIEEHQG